jgi:phenylalanyl-tRNA synthetase alpha chain
MQEALDRLTAELEAESLDSEDAIESFRVRFLGRKAGAITDLFKQIADVSPEERRAFGQHVNALKQRAEARLEEARAALLDGNGSSSEAGSDLTLPGRVYPRGTVHPLTQTLDDIRGIFERFGFEVATGPEIEDDWHNFTALNFPADHPARDMQDTFFIEAPDDDGGVMLRTHTSPVQIRVMESQKPPIRVIVPGRVYRNESISYKSFCLFNQVEGLYVDEGVTFADLKQLLHLFARAVFGDDVRIRFRASYFPFTEPSAEVDVWWKKPSHPDGGMWMEILGCGMVDPAVLDAVGIDSERYTGYAFGMGVDRMAMRRYGIDDIRILYENDLRFLRQF